MQLSLFFLLYVQIVSCVIQQRHVSNSIAPLDNYSPSYNIAKWVVQLNLQQIVIVEIGDSYAAVSNIYFIFF